MVIHIIPLLIHLLNNSSGLSFLLTNVYIHLLNTMLLFKKNNTALNFFHSAHSKFA